MFKTFKQSYLTSILYHSQQFLVTKSSSFDLAKQMKLLNEKKQFRKALDLFHQYEQTNLDHICNLSITQALKACAQIKDLNRGKSIERKFSSRLANDIYILNTLIHFHMCCRNVKHAEKLFDLSKNKTLPTYGAMMRGYITNQLSKKAIDLFEKIDKPDEIVTTIFFSACAQSGTYEQLKLIKKVASTIPNGFYRNPQLLCSLIDAYMKCGDVKSGELVFENTRNKNQYIYGAMMQGYIENRTSDKAIDLFSQIPNPDDVNVICLFNACAQSGTNEQLELVKKVASTIPKFFYQNHRLICSLVDAYMKCGDVKSAEVVFDKSSKKDLHIYATMMKGYIENEMADKAIDLFSQIQNLDDVIITLVFNACAQLGTNEQLKLIKKVAATIPNGFYRNPQLLCSLIDAYMKCGDVKSAEMVFHKTSGKSVDIYETMIQGYLQNAMSDIPNYEIVLHLFEQMKDNQIQPNIIICLTLIEVLAELGDYDTAKSFIQQIPSHFLTDKIIQSTLIHMWGKIGSVDEAHQIFQTIHPPDHTTYASMIDAYGWNGKGIQAVDLFYQIPSELIDDTTYICIIKACSNAGLVQQARSIFENIHNKTEMIYNTMINCLTRASYFAEAKQLVDRFEKDHPPSLDMYMAWLLGVRMINNTDIAKKIFKRLQLHFPEPTESSMPASIILSNMYAASGKIN